MKIGIDIRLIGKKRTGDEAVIFNLVKNLVRIDSENEYFLFTDINDEKQISKIKNSLKIKDKNNFKIVSLPANKFSWNFWILPMYLRKNPVDVYHTQYITPWFIPKKIHPHTKVSNFGLVGKLYDYFKKGYINWRIKYFGVGVKIVTIIHDISFDFFPQFIKFSDLFFLKMLIPISLRRADKIIAVSNFTRNEIVKFYKINPKKIECVYNSISDQFLNGEVSKEHLDEVKNKYNLPEKFILYMGTLQPRKNIPQLIEAFGRIKDKLGNFKLVICGNKKAYNYDKKIDDSIKANNLEKYVIFPGFIDESDKQAVYKLAHIFAFPSLYEGFGIPILEAMSQGIPVIASDIPSLKEIAGKGALYFNTGSLDNFSEKMYNICIDNNLRGELILSGYERISFFSWEKSADKMLAIYKELKHN